MEETTTFIDVIKTGNTFFAPIRKDFDKLRPGDTVVATHSESQDHCTGVVIEINKNMYGNDYKIYPYSKDGWAASDGQVLLIRVGWDWDKTINLKQTL